MGTIQEKEEKEEARVLGGTDRRGQRSTVDERHGGKVQAPKEARLQGIGLKELKSARAGDRFSPEECKQHFAKN